jgi:hypothetical protein
MIRVTGCVLTFGATGLGAIDIVGGCGTVLCLMETIGSSGVIIASVQYLPYLFHSSITLEELFVNLFGTISKSVGCGENVLCSCRWLDSR